MNVVIADYENLKIHIPEVPFVFLRHGTTAWNLSLLKDGFVDYPLVEQGRADARLAAEKLRGKLVDPKVYCSVFLRAVQTCEIVTDILQIKDIKYVSGLRGREYGNVACVCDEIMCLAKERKFDEIEDILPDCAEKKDAFIERCLLTLAGILAENANSGRTVLIVAHDEVCKAFGHYLMNQRLSIDKGGIKEFTATDGKWSVKDW